MLRLQDKIKYIFEMNGFQMTEEGTIEKIEKEKIYIRTTYNEQLIFDNNTKACLADNTTFGAKRTLID